MTDEHIMAAEPDTWTWPDAYGDDDMHPLDRLALTNDVLPAEPVRALAAVCQKLGMHRLLAAGQKLADVHRLCASHERLRMENDGATALLEQAAGEIDRHRAAIRAALAVLDAGACSDGWVTARDTLRAVLAAHKPGAA